MCFFNNYCVLFVFTSMGKMYSKKARDYRLVIKKEAKDYSYIRELQTDLLRERLSGGALPARSIKRPDDARRLGVLCGKPAPTTEELMQARQQREM